MLGVLFLTFLDTTIVAVALASVQTSLGAGVSALQWVVNGYALAFACLMLAAGSLADRVGRRKMLLLGLGIFSAGSLIAALASSPGMLIAGRVVMGVGAAASEPGTLSIIRHLYPDPKVRARALGSWAATSGLALASGPILGGLLVGAWSWRGIFWLNLVAGVLLTAAARVVLPESRDPSGLRFDYGGLLSGAGALGCLSVAVILGESAGYGAGIEIFLLAAGAVLIGVFVFVERRAAAPLLDLSYLKLAPFSGALVVAFTLFFGVFSIFFFTALFLQVVDGYSGYRAALEFLPMTVCLIGSSLVAGRIVSRAGPRLPMALGALLAGGGTIWSEQLLAHPGAPPGWLIVSLALAGLGFGGGIVPVTSVALNVVPGEHSGMAASATNTSRELGAVFGVGVLGSLVNGNLTGSLALQLRHLGIPSAFQAIVIGAIERGQVPGGSSASAAAATYGPIATRVIHAAYGAFRSGLDVALIVAGSIMLAAALVAATTLSDRRHLPDGSAE